MWHLTRWDGLFLGTYLVTHLGAPPIANQFVGVGMFAPMLLGAYFSARNASHRNKPHLVLRTELVLLPISVLMAVLVGTGVVQTWMVYPFMLAYGFGGMVNMTTQRELLFSMSGPLRSTRVINTEVAATASAMMLGPLIGGITIQAFGLGVAFAVPAVLLATSAPLLWFSTRHMPAGSIPIVPEAAVGGGRKTDWHLLRRSRPLAVIVLVTVICNLFYFSFMPLVPVIAKNLDADALMAGVIGSTAGTVALAVAGALVIRPARHPFNGYVAGVALCLCCLAVLAYTPSVVLALLALGVAGVGQAYFGSAQAMLPAAVVAPQERAAALGLVTTGIGLALPAGMVILGVMSSLLGPRLAMLVSALAGLAALGATVLTNREMSGGAAVSGGREGDPVTAQPELG
ncbi:MFS transporter [Mycobacterium antarcticum]|uniref:MFS transporter n=1 Tax=Mycolicibacterium sp. TUM20983 TaxID=3023369 RepID=UPI0024E0A406|nr:MFS transporter [Mycolicibacterium sp. TUM20983]